MLYQFYSQTINNECSTHGIIILNHYYIKKMR